MGCRDVRIADGSASNGMNGPAMIEGGGLGVSKLEDGWLVSVQAPDGVIDVPVREEADAVAVAKKHPNCFRGPLNAWTCPDQRLLRRVLPENRVHDIRKLIHILCDTLFVAVPRKGYGLAHRR